MGRVIGCHVSGFSSSSSCRGKFSKILANESHFERFGTHTAGQRASHRCDSSKQLSFRPWVDGKLFHDDLNGCWVPLELTFIASAVVTRMRMRCYGHMAHGTSPLYTSVRSLRDLHSCVNSVSIDLHLGTRYINLHL